MNTEPNSNSDQDLPNALVEDLRQLAEPVTAVAPERDQQILAAAGQILADQTKSRQRTGRWWPIAAAAAVAAVIGIGLFMPPVSSPIDPISTATAARPDLDGNGTIDILDAFALARELEAGRNVSRLDVNGDGQVDRTDVDQIARQAVALGEGS
jgi:hypothetical protein